MSIQDTKSLGRQTKELGLIREAREGQWGRGSDLRHVGEKDLFADRVGLGGHR